jgi:hypothetical protein
MGSIDQPMFPGCKYDHAAHVRVADFIRETQPEFWTWFVSTQGNIRSDEKYLDLFFAIISKELPNSHLNDATNVLVVLGSALNKEPRNPQGYRIWRSRRSMKS